MDVRDLLERLEHLDFGLFQLSPEGAVEAGFTPSCGRLLGRDPHGATLDEIGVPSAGGVVLVDGRSVELLPVVIPEVAEVWTVRDVTDRVSAETRARRAETVLETIRDALADAVRAEAAGSEPEGPAEAEARPEAPAAVEAPTEATVAEVEAAPGPEHEAALAVEAGDDFEAWLRAVASELAAAGEQRVELDLEAEVTWPPAPVKGALKESLPVLLENAAVHGASGGALRVSVGHRVDGDGWEVQVADEGPGFDLEGLGERALSRGLVSPEQLRSMAPHERLALAFLPADGPGLPQIRRRLASVGAEVEIRSASGRGATVTLRGPA